MTQTTRAFHGQWITNDAFFDTPPRNVFHRQLDVAARPAPDPDLRNRHVLFRKTFTLDHLADATLFITADDYYKCYLNGVFVGQGPSAGYAFHYFYNTFDVSALLKPGENTLAVHTYYQGLINRVWVSGDRRHGLLLDLCVGGAPVVRSDETFRCVEHTGYGEMGVVGYQTQIMERYDAAAPEAGFARPDYDDAGWTPARAHRHAGDYRLFAQPSATLAFADIAPATVRQDGDVCFVDFGAMYVGSLACRATGRRGDEITLRFGQELNDDGTVRHRLRANCVYEEAFRLSGREDGDALDQFDYKAFRYAALTLPPGAAVDPDSIRLRARHYPFTLAARPKYTDAKARQVWDLCVDTLKWGMQEVIQDCMDREKGYYMGDGCYSQLTWCLLTDDFGPLEKFFDDFLRTRFITRGLMTCAACSFMQEIAEYPLIMTTTFMAYLELTGREDFARERYAAFADVLDYYRERYAGPDGLLNHLDKWCVVEWPANMRDGYDVDLAEGRPCDTLHNVINAYYIGAVKSLNKVAARLGLPPYADAAPLARAFADAFYDPARGLFRDRADSDHVSVPGNAYALFYELFPDTTDAAFAFLREKRLSQSMFFVTFPQLASLARAGDHAFVHELLTDDRYWLHMIREGATRTFEGWSRDLKWNTSLFHLTLACGAAFMLDRDISGVFTFD